MHGQPRVRINSPTLERHSEYEEGPLPHVYRVGDDDNHVVLCLFDVNGHEWTPIDLIAETTLKWTCLWLNFYEGWLATKRWYGGGTHPTHPGAEKKIEHSADE